MNVAETKTTVGNVVVENEFSGPPLHSLLPRCKLKMEDEDGRWVSSKAVKTNQSYVENLF